MTETGLKTWIGSIHLFDFLGLHPDSFVLDIVEVLVEELLLGHHWLGRGGVFHIAEEGTHEVLIFRG